LHTILELSDALQARRVSALELTRGCLARIEKLNPVLNAFITVTAEPALAQARRADQEIARGNWRGPLHGIPLGLKDLIDTAGIPTTAASLVYKYRIPMQSAPVAQALEEAGAILLGKHNLHEFAYGGSSMVSAFGAVHNPWDPAHIAGGSSGGSAAAVASGLGYAAIGTDTAGSIREPAALCGLVGLKPTYGRVSAAGVIPLSRSLDHVGPITTRVLDAALLLQVLCRTSAGGADQAAPWPEDFLAQVQQSPRALRGGIPRSFFFDELDSGVATAIEQALGVVRTLVADLREVALEPDTDRTLQALESYRVHRDTVQASPDLYQPETLRRIRSGENITPADYQEALARLQAARQNIGRWFADMDFLITPTTPIPAPAIAELKEHPENLRPRELLLLRNTRPFNVWGLPAVSVPCGFSERGLPIGLQIAGPPGREDLVLRLAHAYERATVWHRRRPALRLDGTRTLGTAGVEQPGASG